MFTNMCYHTLLDCASKFRRRGITGYRMSEKEKNQQNSRETEPQGGNGSEDGYRFLDQTIKKKPASRGNILLRIFGIAVSGIAVGLIAAVVFSLIHPEMIEAVYEKKEEAKITIPADEDPEAAAVQTASSETAEETGASAESELEKTTQADSSGAETAGSGEASTEAAPEKEEADKAPETEDAGKNDGAPEEEQDTQEEPAAADGTAGPETEEPGSEEPEAAETEAEAEVTDTEEPGTEDEAEEPGSEDAEAEEPGTEEAEAADPEAEETGTENPDTEMPEDPSASDGTAETKTEEPGTAESAADEAGTEEQEAGEAVTEAPETGDTETEGSGAAEPGTEAGLAEGSEEEPGAAEPGMEDPESGAPGADGAEEEVPEEDGLGISLEEYRQLYQDMFAVAEDAEHSLVQVIGITSEMDYFNQNYESQRRASGLIVAMNSSDLFILTEYRAVEQAERIQIVFCNSRMTDATYQLYDQNTGLAVVKVQLNNIGEETLEELQTARLGNSYVVRRGEPVLALGSPTGYSDSIVSGIITSVGGRASAVDLEYELMMTDIEGSSDGSGVLIDLDGKVIGIITHAFGMDRDDITALAVSPLKKLIQDLSNNEPQKYIGIRGQDVTQEIADRTGIPRGVLVTEVIADSPAMLAGIKEYDVIVRFGEEQTIATMEDYQRAVRLLSPDDVITVTAMRKGIGGYAEITFEVTVEGR